MIAQGRADELNRACGAGATPDPLAALREILDDPEPMPDEDSETLARFAREVLAEHEGCLNVLKHGHSELADYTSSVIELAAARALQPAQPTNTEGGE